MRVYWNERSSAIIVTVYNNSYMSMNRAQKILAPLIIIVGIAAIIANTIKKPIVSIYSSGGNCLFATCDSLLIILRDGSWIYTMGGKESKGKIEYQMVTKLARIMKNTNFEELRQKPFTGVCPSAYDGMESTYTFYIQGRKEELNNCTIDTQGVLLFDEISSLSVLLAEQVNQK